MPTVVVVVVLAVADETTPAAGAGEGPAPAPASADAFAWRIAASLYHHDLPPNSTLTVPSVSTMRTVPTSAMLLIGPDAASLCNW
jgi:hypothetical protein